jgi:Protein of unknown function (DUF4245)
VSQPRPARSGMRWRWTDVIRSIVVVLAVIGVVAFYQAVLTEDPADPTPSVEYGPAAEAARDDAGYPILAPARLPDGWQATSVRYRPGERWAWHLGVLTADEEYVGLEQAPVEPDQLVEEAAEGTEPAGTTTIDGEVWQLRRDEERDETTLVRRSQGVTTLVTGSTDQSTLEDYVRSLRGT